MFARYDGDVNLAERYQQTRARTMFLLAGLSAEDANIQTSDFASPAKWHAAHTTWFFEEFVLAKNPNYRRFDARFAYLFNSYYETVGKRQDRAARGVIARPSLDDVLAYRQRVDESMLVMIADHPGEEMKSLIELGIHHEQQHQELLLTDITYNFAQLPFDNDPVSANMVEALNEPVDSTEPTWLSVSEQTISVGATGDEFCFDNEVPRHRVLIPACEIRSTLVSNREYLAFMEDGGYTTSRLWHMDGWQWVQDNCVRAPAYWGQVDGEWTQFSVTGRKAINPDLPVTHISYYEAAAYALWAGVTLPTEFQWEAAAEKIHWGQRWEWTNSAYQPYPGFRAAVGAIGEYNGKFMVNQMVLRGASVATSPGHSRTTYRNFFYAHQRWQFTGIRLARYA